MHRKIFYFFLVLALMPMLMNAGTKGRIKGKVTDMQTGEALIGANVFVFGTSIGAATDANGEFVLMNLEAGTYDVKASYLGYQTITLKGVRVNSDLTVEADFELPSEDISVDVVEITAVRPLVNKDNTNAVRITSSEDIKALPVRGINAVLNLTAGVVFSNGNLHIRGGRQDEVGYYLEGVTITNPTFGGRAVSLSQDAVEEIQVQAGGYTAEFGGANAGIIRQSLRSGGTQIRASYEYITDNVTFKSNDDALDGERRLGAYWRGYNEHSAVISGPLFDQKVKFFFNVNYIFNRDPNAQDFPGANFPNISDPTNKDTVNLVVAPGPRRHNTEDRYNFVGTLNLDLKPFLVRLSGTYAANRFDAGAFGLSNVMRNRLGETNTRNGSFSLKVTHVISPEMFYEVSGGLFITSGETQDPWLKRNYWAYSDSAANADVGFVWDRTPQDIERGNIGPYKRPASYNVYGFNFGRDGVSAVSYSKNHTFSYSLNGTFNLLVGKTHSIKLGGEYRQYTIRNWNARSQTSLSGALDQLVKATPGADVETLQRSLLLTNGVNNYGYDVLGKWSNEDGFNAAHKPVFASAYLTDKIEYEDIILNVGLRYDYFDIDNLQMIDPANPDKSFLKSGELTASGWTKMPTFSALSPRIGVSFPVTDKTMFHAQFGKFVQQTRLRDAYQGYYWTAWTIKGGFFDGSPVGNNIRPTRTTQYEIGFSQQIGDNMSFDVTGYYKDIKDQIVYKQTTTSRNSDYSAYSVYANGDFATTKGLELSFTMRRQERLAANATVSFQDARGTGSFPNSNRGIVGAPIDGSTIFEPAYISPLEFNNALRANANLDYRFGPNDGPSFLHNFGASLLIKYNSGRPFTRGVGNGFIGFTTPGSGDARFRTAAEPLNSSTTPDNFQMDLRIDKTFNLFDQVTANVYVFVINVFDTKNVRNVFVKTGSPTDDGFISNPEESAPLINQYGPIYEKLYRTMNIDNAGLYGPSRQIRLGIRLEY